MATKNQSESAAENNGKPLRHSPAPMIRLTTTAEEDGKTRLFTRLVPAFAISGLIHLVAVIGIYYLLKAFPDDAKANEIKDPPVSTSLDQKPETPIDLTNPDPEIDSELPASVDVEVEKDVNVDAPVVEGEAAGLPNQEKDFAPVTSNLGEKSLNIAAPGILNPAADGIVGMGEMGHGGQLAMQGLNGRSGATKIKLIKQGGGNDASERAVALALVWLAKQQNVSVGFWEFDGTSKGDRVAATGLSLLPFLAAGETHMTGKKYKENVRKGLNYLTSPQILKPNGQFGGSGMYSQAIAAVALCEAAGMTRDDQLKSAARRAIDFIVKAQAGNGSWGYTAGEAGDTSIVGWQIQALKSAQLAGITVPDKAFKQAVSFLESVSDSGATYGYRAKGATPTLTAVGLLSRVYASGWNPKNPAYARGVDYLWKGSPPKEEDLNIYYYYYATQAVHFFDGPVWHRDWNPKMRDLLVKLQIRPESKGAKAADAGSWPKDTGFIGSACGKLGTTAMACLTLEVYYRHLPLYKRDGGLNELERGNR